ncbi:MotA/TolQ/ExbB proton channel family protein [bacterium]|nr:MotA/TolQ/ExbB proton channel family protein [bacterium]
MLQTLIHFIHQGGLMMIPLLTGILVALTMIVERFFRLISYTRHIALIDPVSDAISRGDLAEARRKLEAHAGPIPTVLRTGISNIDGNPELLDNALKVAFYEEAQHLQKFLPTIQVLGAIFPMLGLLGSVMGMVHIFSGLGAVGMADPGVMARGISEALISTETGLAGAIPVMFFYNGLVSMSDRLMLGLKRATVTLHHLSAVRKDQ